MALFDNELPVPHPTRTGFRVGTSGYSYADWKGPFYPMDLPEGEMLSFYAKHFCAVEVNYTYYRLPSVRTSVSMLHKAPHLEYVIKLFGGITHESEPHWEDLHSFNEGIKPFYDAGRLGVILAQFPWGFKPSMEAWDRIKRIAEGLAEFVVNIEFRNLAWHTEDVRQTLTSMGLGIVNVDEPALKGLLPPGSFLTNKVGYVRFHGRNGAKWWKNDSPEERYDYSYSTDELVGWLDKLKEVNKNAERSYIFFNNHPLGQAVVAAEEMLRLLAEETL
jgi:uncharacterized protein YecE (DUF72 family)